MSTHTVDDVKRLMDAIGICPKTAKAILEAIAPAIASRALREAAEWVAGLFEPDADLFVGDMVSMLERRANLVDPSGIVAGS